MSAAARSASCFGLQSACFSSWEQILEAKGNQLVLPSLLQHCLCYYSASAQSWKDNFLIDEEDDAVPPEERRKAHGRRAARWACHDPAPRLAVLHQILSLNSELMSRSLHLSSKAWEEEQRQKLAQGGTRSFRALEAFENDIMQTFFAQICVSLSEMPLGLPQRGQTLTLRHLAFRGFCRAACAGHVLLRKPRQGYPLKLFGALQEEQPFATVRSDRPCMFDELTTRFLQNFGDLSQKDTQALAMAALTALAECIELDIATIECRHASVRRCTQHSSVQTWLASLEDVAANFVTRQWALMQSKHLEGRRKCMAGAEETRTSVHHQKSQQRQNRQKKQGSGGGAFRAFMHANNLSPKLSHEASQQFRSLSTEDMEYYQDVGARALEAWKRGYAAFGKRAHKRSCKHMHVAWIPPCESFAKVCPGSTVNS